MRKTAALTITTLAPVSVSGVNTDLNSYLFGSILATTTADAIMCGILALVVIVIFILFYNKIFAVTFDETFSRATGLKTGVYNTVIAHLTAHTIVIGMRIMGTLLISALIIFPALSSMRVCKKFDQSEYEENSGIDYYNACTCREWKPCSKSIRNTAGTYTSVTLRRHTADART